MIPSLSLEAIQAEIQTEFRGAVQGLHETMTSEVEQLMAEVRLSLSHLNEKVECYQEGRSPRGYGQIFPGTDVYPLY